jgi:hypothetical protein
MARMRSVLRGIAMAAGTVWVLGFGLFGVAVLLVAPPVGALALGLAALPVAGLFFGWIGRGAEPVSVSAMGAGPRLWSGPPSHYARPMIDATRITREALEPGLITAIDLAGPLTGPAGGGPWMPIEVTSPSPPALRPMSPGGAHVPMVAEAGIVLAGPRPRQALRHMIAAYLPGVAETALRDGPGNELGAFGNEVAAMSRLPDTYPVGEVCTTVRIVDTSGLVSHVVVWRRGPLITQLAATGDETLMTVQLGHAARVADSRLQHLLIALGGRG